jgi:hypothetical protein
VGNILTRSSFDPAMVEAVEFLIVRLQPLLMEKIVSSVDLEMSNNLRISFIAIQLPEATQLAFYLTVFWSNEQSVRMNYEATQQDIAVLRGLL